jgi:hypothetical protein
MKKLLAPLAALACVVGLTAAPPSPAAADTISVGEADWSAALTFPDLQWSSESCQFLPVTVAVTGAVVQSWTFGGMVQVSVEAEDEDEGWGGPSWFMDYDKLGGQGPGTFTFRHAVMLCPGADPTGPYDVIGEVGVLRTGAAEHTWKPFRASFTVTGIPTTTQLDSIVQADGDAMFSGSVTPAIGSSTTFRGCTGARVVAEQQVASDWEYLGDASVARSGSFAVMVPTSRMTGTQFRVWLYGGLVCEESASEPVAQPFKVPRIQLGSNRRQSVLRVDLDPNRGRKAWKFQVQRNVGDDEDAWETVGTYRTQGSKETRTVNVRKGQYRVLVPAQAGYVATYSESWWIER